MESWIMPVFWVIVIAAVICFKLLKKSSNCKAAQSGEDLERLCNAMRLRLAGGGNNQTLYAHWEERTHYGRTVKTTYYRYAVTYQDQALYVAPLKIDKKTREIQAGQPVAFTLQNLGKTVVKTKQKDGSTARVEICLIDKQGKNLLELYVDAINLRKNHWYPVNIAQQAACEAFGQFMTVLAQRVAAENPGVDDIIKANGNEGAGVMGAVIAAIGAVAAIFFSPVGLLLSLIGLLIAVVSKCKGAKGKKALIISILCTLWSAGFLWLSLKYYLL